MLSVGIGSKQDIRCDIDTGVEFPNWFLNDTVYTLSGLLLTFPLFAVKDNVNNTLTVTVEQKLDNTLFRCGVLNGSTLILGVHTRLFISTF